MKDFDSKATESLKDLSKEAMEGSEQLKPVDLPKDTVDEAQRDFSDKVSFKSTTINMCVCAKGIRCPSK